jgi:carboxymethylenebutenolidase
VNQDAQHGFFADNRPSYNEVDAKIAWTRALGWLVANGVK